MFFFSPFLSFPSHLFPKTSLLGFCYWNFPPNLLIEVYSSYTLPLQLLQEPKDFIIYPLMSSSHQAQVRRGIHAPFLVHALTFNTSHNIPRLGELKVTNKTITRSVVYQLFPWDRNYHHCAHSTVEQAHIQEDWIACLVLHILSVARGAWFLYASTNAANMVRETPPSGWEVLHSFPSRPNFQCYDINFCFEVLLLDRQLQFLREQRKHLGNRAFCFSPYE